MSSPQITPRLRRLQWLLWFGALALFIALVRYPVSTLYTRTASLALIVFLWAGLLLLLWRIRWVRFAHLGFTAMAAGFLIWPFGGVPSTAELRADYTAALRRYDGVAYCWGGENARGIDCSGLVRRGLVNALGVRGLRTANPALVRRAFALWWNDTTASAMGNTLGGQTVAVFETPSINETDPAKFLPGDLAVTSGGAHVMAYLGDRQWIEADPQEGQVITLTTPSNPYWFKTAMKIVRWKDLAP